MSEPTANLTPDLEIRRTNSRSMGSRRCGRSAILDFSSPVSTIWDSKSWAKNPSYTVGVSPRKMPFFRIDCSCSSVTPLPCSIESTPASMAVWTATVVVAWAATFLCARCASSTIALRTGGVIPAPSSSTTTLMTSTL